VIARTVTYPIKTGKAPEFTKLFNTEFRPTLRAQTGYTQDLAWMSGENVICINVWKDKAAADTYHRTVFPTLVKKLDPVLNGAPKVELNDLLPV
jgi:quinol monooxygenase YgiN